MAETNPIEEWRVVDGFTDYEVSDQGHVRRRTDSIRVHHQTGRLFVMYESGRLKLASPDRNGYLTVRLTNGTVSRLCFVNILVCAAWHGPRPSRDHHAAHWDGDSLNNHPCNLRWATRAENEADKLRHGRSNRGERHPLSKLTTDNVLEIRHSTLPGSALAKKFSVSQGTISGIRSGHSWSWL